MKRFPLISVPGMKAFLTEYLIVRQIPIANLLYAFGISLVREVFSFEFPIGAKLTVQCKELRQKQLKTQTYFLRVVIFQV